MTEQNHETGTDTDIGSQLLEKYGPLMTGEDLWRTVGYTSAAAFRQAKAKGRLDIEVFKLPNRRGNYAFTHDVAGWLNELAKEVRKPKNLQL